MSTFYQLLQEHGQVDRFHAFQNLMRRRVREVLLVSSLYDSFILEEDGQLYEMIHSEYHDLNLSQAPGLTRVSSGREAVELIREQRRFDLIITTLNPGDMDVLELARSIKTAEPDVPIVLLTYDDCGLNELTAHYDISDFETVFIWQGDYRILISIIKLVEDRLNVENDTRAVGVQSIIVIEDNVHFYSSFLPMIYSVLFRHSQSLISEGINVKHKLLRMRARPKILLCTTYEEAWDTYEKYEECVLGVISDIEFPRSGRSDPEAGIRFARAVKESHFDIPILLQSDSPQYREVAKNLGVSFLLKTSPILLHDLQRFMKNNLSFGDFVFRYPDGSEIARAGDLRTLERKLHTIPDESLVFHGERNHFSNWLKARTEFWLAHQLRPQLVGDFESVDALRLELIKSLRDYRRERDRGTIADFDPNGFDATSSFARIGGGSLGGKARGLGFIVELVNRFRIQNRFRGIQISVPPAVVLGTDVFDKFVDDNELRDFAIQCEDDAQIYERFAEGRFPDRIVADLSGFLDLIQYPLAVRSSSLLEDSRYLPFAGVYMTYMLGNNHEDPNVRLEQLLVAVKRVYASTFCSRAKAYIRAAPYRLEEEKMAVIVQKLVGEVYQDRFYPDFSGVVRSHNFYPQPPMTTTDGIASVALGLGKTVIEGGLTVRFCPKYPRHLTQFADIEDTLNYSQKSFYALRLDGSDECEDNEPDVRLRKYGLDVAERDGTLAYIGSTYSMENNAIYDGLSRQGVRLATFAPILKNDLFPLPDVLRLITDMGHWGMSAPVEIEFAVNLSTAPGTPKEFAFLQIRPLVRSHEIGDLKLDDIDTEELICRSSMVLGNGLIDDVFDMVVVDPERFERSKTVEVAREVAMYNAELSTAGRPYILVGVGRWGSADPWLGIPIKWEQISGARVIIEAGFRDIRVVPSQGTHFFQNLMSFRIGYFTVDLTTGDGFVDWLWLASQNEVSRKTYMRHLRFAQPILIKMNGHENKGIVQKPQVLKQT
jgi:hypothetical protein